MPRFACRGEVSSAYFGALRLKIMDEAACDEMARDRHGSGMLRERGGMGLDDWLVASSMMRLSGGGCVCFVMPLK